MLTNYTNAPQMTITDSLGKRRNLVRRAKDKSDGKAILKTILQQLDNQGEKAVEVANKTFNELCDLYERVYLHEAQYVHERKVSGLRALDRAERAVRLPSVPIICETKSWC